MPSTSPRSHLYLQRARGVYSVLVEHVNRPPGPAGRTERIGSDREGGAILSLTKMRKRGQIPLKGFNTETEGFNILCNIRMHRK